MVSLLGFLERVLTASAAFSKSLAESIFIKIIVIHTSRGKKAHSGCEKITSVQSFTRGYLLHSSSAFLHPKLGLTLHHTYNTTLSKYDLALSSSRARLPFSTSLSRRFYSSLSEFSTLDFISCTIGQMINPPSMLWLFSLQGSTIFV